MDTQTVRLLAGGLLAAIYSFSSKAEITLDGSLGPAGGAIPFDANNQFEIREEMGRTVGSNLFHSFGTFNIAAGETAAFTGTSPIENVLSRVTGGTASSIDGTLRTDFANAAPNLYLLNPAGVVFGPNASLDVQGSFHVSTADYLRLEDGVRFNGIPLTADQVLTTAPPEAFGFLGDNPGDISIEGALLEVPNGENLSVVGGDVQIKSGVLSDNNVVSSQIEASSGRIDLRSVGSPSEIEVGVSGSPVESDNIKRGSVAVLDGSLIEVDGSGGDGLFITAGKFTISDSSAIVSTISTSGKGSDITVSAKEIEVTKGGLIDVSSTGSGVGGNLTVIGENITLDGLEGGPLTGLFANTQGEGGGGDLKISASNLAISNGAIIGTNTTGLGDAGDLTILAGNVSLDSITGGFPSGLFVTTTGTEIGGGDAGKLSIEAANVQMTNGSIINGETFGLGQGGDIQIVAENLRIEGFAQLIASDAGNLEFFSSGIVAGSRSSLRDVNSAGSAQGGTISLDVGRLELRSGGYIDGSTLGPGDGGSLSIKATDVFLEGTGAGFRSGLFLNTQGTGAGSGNAGQLNIDATSVEIRNGARIFANTSGPGIGGDINILATDRIEVHEGSQVAAGTFGLGDGGNLTIRAGDLILEGGDGVFSSGLFVSTAGLEPDAGDAGQLNVEANNVRIENNGNIGANSSGPGAAGDIQITANSLLSIRDGAQVGAATAGAGNGGNLTVRAKEVILSGESGENPAALFVNSQGTADDSGDGGQLIVDAGNIQIADGASIAANTFGPGRGGEIQITAQDQISVRNGAEVGVSTVGSGDGGNLIVAANSVLLDRGGDSSRTGLFANAQGSELGSGNGGNLRVKSTNLQVKNGAEISTSSFGPGSGGNLTIEGQDVLLDGEGDRSRSGLFARAEGNALGSSDGGKIIVDVSNLQLNDGAEISALTGGQGKGGDIEISVDNLLSVSNRAQINTAAFGSGDGGNLTIRGKDVVLDGAVDELPPTGLFVNTQGFAEDSGNAGQLSISARSFRIMNGATIAANSFGPGLGGDIQINSEFIELTKDGSVLSLSFGDGNAGNIEFYGVKNFVSRGGNVTAEASEADGGNIIFKVDNVIGLIDTSISASVRSGGDGGNIDIDPRVVVLADSEIIAQAVDGKGGNIGIVSDFIFRSPSSVVDASSQAGIDGTVEIDSPDTNISGSIAALPETYINAANQLSEHCGARTTNRNSFVIRGRGSIRLAPVDFSPASSLGEGDDGELSDNGTPAPGRNRRNEKLHGEEIAFTDKNESHPPLVIQGVGCDHR